VRAHPDECGHTGCSDVGGISAENMGWGLVEIHLGISASLCSGHVGLSTPLAVTLF
jgi:hypothetical protein